MVVGHPCSLRRGLVLQADVPVAPLVEQGVPTRRHASTDRLLPVRKLLPPGSETHHVVDLTLATTIPADRLDMTQRCACLSNAGIVALQQRLVGNLVRVKVPPGVITKHCRGPLTELELWTDWRAEIVDAGLDAEARDEEFDEFMRQRSGFGTLSWREAIARTRACAWKRGHSNGEPPRGCASGRHSRILARLPKRTVRRPDGSTSLRRNWHNPRMKPGHGSRPR